MFPQNVELMDGAPPNRIRPHIAAPARVRESIDRGGGLRFSDQRGRAKGVPQTRC